MGELINSTINFTIALAVYLPKAKAVSPRFCDPLNNSGWWWWGGNVSSTLSPARIWLYLCDKLTTYNFMLVELIGVIYSL